MIVNLEIDTEDSEQVDNTKKQTDLGQDNLPKDKVYFNCKMITSIDWHKPELYCDRDVFK